MTSSRSSPDSVMKLFVSCIGPISRCWRVIPSAVWMRSSGLGRAWSESASRMAARDVWVRREVWRFRCDPVVGMAPSMLAPKRRPTKNRGSAKSGQVSLFSEEAVQRLQLHRTYVLSSAYFFLAKRWWVAQPQNARTRAPCGHHGDHLEASAHIRNLLRRLIPAGPLVLRVWQQLVRSTHTTTHRESRQRRIARRQRHY